MYAIRSYYEYITNIGEVVGKEYTIEWKYISDEDQGVVSTPEVTPDNENTDSVITSYSIHYTKLYDSLSVETCNLFKFSYTV